MEILEIGYGTGSTAIAHAPYVKHIQAVDVSSKMLEIAQGKADADNVKKHSRTLLLNDRPSMNSARPIKPLMPYWGSVSCTYSKTKKR